MPKKEEEEEGDRRRSSSPREIDGGEGEEEDNKGPSVLPLLCSLALNCAACLLPFAAFQETHSVSQRATHIDKNRGNVLFSWDISLNKYFYLSFRSHFVRLKVVLRPSPSTGSATAATDSPFLLLQLPTLIII